MHSDKVREALGLHRRMPECPTDLKLDQWSSGEPCPDVDDHVRGCESCQAAVSAKRAAFAKLGADQHQAMIDAIYTEAVRAKAFPSLSVEPEAVLKERAPFVRVISKSRTVWGALAMAAAILISINVSSLLDHKGSRDVTRPKGLSEIALNVYRYHDGKVERMSSQQQAHPQDRLRFQVSAPSGYWMVLGVEANGKIYPCFPSTQADAKAQYFQAVAKHVLPGAIELDSSLGVEGLNFVMCPRPFATHDLRIEGLSVVPPAGCSVSTFKFEKALKNDG